jgi:hypothetical protein
MPAPLLATKLTVLPPGPIRIDGQYLVHRLDERLRPGCRLGIVSAQAGFAKTMLTRKLYFWLTTFAL